SNNVSSVSQAPLVAIVYLRDCVGLKMRSICCPAARSTATALNGSSAPGSGVLPGYHLAAQVLSDADSTPGGTRPSRSYFCGSSIKPGSNSYSMIESGSHDEPWTCCGSSFSRMLWKVVWRDQLLGGPPSDW